MILVAVVAWMFLKWKEPAPSLVVPSAAINPTKAPTVPLIEATSSSPWVTVPQEIPLAPTFATYGGGQYQPVAGNPVPIGDTGFFIWGASPEGAPIISMNPPESYAAEGWLI